MLTRYDRGVSAGLTTLPENLLLFGGDPDVRVISYVWLWMCSMTLIISALLLLFELLIMQSEGFQIGPCWYQLFIDQWYVCVQLSPHQ